MILPRIMMTLSSNRMVPYQSRNIKFLIFMIMLYCSVSDSDLVVLITIIRFVVYRVPVSVYFRLCISFNSSTSITDTFSFQILPEYNAYPRNNQVSLSFQIDEFFTVVSYRWDDAEPRNIQYDGSFY